MGCGTGGVLKRIKETYGQDVVIGGSDLSKNAIERIRLTFPNEMENFHVGSMIQKQFVPDNSQDHVLRYSAEIFLSTCLVHQLFFDVCSVGAFAMYLYEDQMEIALKEALRIVKPGGHICLTNFVEPGGWIGSILEPIKKSHGRNGQMNTH